MSTVPCIHGVNIFRCGTGADFFAPQGLIYNTRTEQERVRERREDVLDRLRVATFNVNSLRSRLPILETWLPRAEVDVLGFQETKVEDGSFPETFFRDRGYDVVFRGQKSYNGVAVASRLPLTEVAFGFGDGEEPGDETRLLQCTVGGVRLLNSYVPQGKALDHADFAYKLRFFQRLRKLLERSCRPEDPVLWMGDLNVVPTDRDVTHPENKRQHVCVHEDVRRALEDVLSWGLEDVFRRHRPEDGEFSFWDYRVPRALERNIGWRIDHFFATPALARRSTGALVERSLRQEERPSDHTAVVVDFSR